MPRTANGLADQRAVGQRRTVMRTHRIERKELLAFPDEQNCLVPHMTGDHSAVREVVDRDPLLQLGAGSRFDGRFAHAVPHRRRNSDLVSALLRRVPSIEEVISCVAGSLTPRHPIQRWCAAMATPTPRASRWLSTACAICWVIRS